MESIGEAVLVLRTDVKEYIASLEDSKKRAEAFQQRLDRMSAAASNTVKPLSDAADNLNNFGRNAGDAGKKADGAGAKVDPFSKKLDKLSSLSEQSSIALGTLNSRLQAMAFASVIASISIIIPKVLEWFGATRKITIETDALNKTILDGSIKYGLLSKSQREVTETTVALFNAELNLAQFRAVRDQGAIREKIEALEEENRVKIEARRKNAELLESMQANHPLYLSTVAAFTRQSETILENNVEIEKLTSREKDLTQILSLKKTTLEEVKTKTGLLTDAERTQLEILHELERASEARRTGQIIEDAERDERINDLLKEADAFREIAIAKNDLLIDLPSGGFSSDEMRGQAEAELRLLETNKMLTRSYEDRFLAIEALGGLHGEFARQMAIENMVIEYKLSLLNALNSGLYTWVLGQQKLGPAIRASVAQVLAAKAAEAGVNAIFATAEGFFYLAKTWGVPNPASIAAFTAAGQYAAVAAAAGVAARNILPRGGGGGGTSAGATGGGTPTVGLRDTRVVSRPPVTLNLTIQGNVVGQEAWIHEELIPAIEDASINERSKLAMKEN